MNPMLGQLGSFKPSFLSAYDFAVLLPLFNFYSKMLHSALYLLILLAPCLSTPIKVLPRIYRGTFLSRTVGCLSCIAPAVSSCLRLSKEGFKIAYDAADTASRKMYSQQSYTTPRDNSPLVRDLDNARNAMPSDDDKESNEGTNSVADLHQILEGGEVVCEEDDIYQDLERGLDCWGLDSEEGSPKCAYSIMRIDLGRSDKQDMVSASWSHVIYIGG
jgi:hypothetical protein